MEESIRRSYSNLPGAIPFTSDALIDTGDYTYDANDTIVDGCTLTINGAHTFNSLHIINGGIVNHSSGQAGFDLTIKGDLMVDAEYLAVWFSEAIMSNTFTTNAVVVNGPGGSIYRRHRTQGFGEWVFYDG